MPTRATRRYIARVAQSVIDDNLETKHADFIWQIPNPGGQAVQVVIRPIVNIEQGDAVDERVGNEIDLHSFQLQGRLRPATVNNNASEYNESGVRLIIVRTRSGTVLSTANLGQILEGGSNIGTFQGYRSFYTTITDKYGQYAAPYDILFDRLYIKDIPGETSIKTRIYIKIVQRYRRPLKVRYATSQAQVEEGQLWAIIIPTFDGGTGAISSNRSHYYGDFTYRLRWTDG